MNANLSAFLRVIREGESSHDDLAYRTLYGGDLFDDFSRHPNTVVTAGGYTSTAAGAYQFLYRTWSGLGLPDFTPANQDKGAVMLIERRGALQDVEAGRFEQAIQKCNKEWASLPGSPYGQKTMSMEQAKRVYAEYGGTFSAASKEIPMASKQNVFFDVALGALTSAIPALGALFAGSETAQRNTKAAEVIVNIAKEAVGAVNEQELITSLENAESVKVVEKAVQENWFAIQEAGGGGIKGARDAEVAQMQSGVPLLRSATFWTGLLLLPMVYMIVGSITFNLGGEWDSAVRASIASNVVGLILGSLVGYYFGASRNAGANMLKK